MVDTQSKVRLGMLTPSSNSVLEPMTARMLVGQPGITAHFARLRVTQIGLSSAALDQFDQAPMLAASELLADARVAAILWNGTAGAWLGFASDAALSEAITRQTGVPASTSALAFRDLFRKRGITRVGLVTPYTGDVQAQIQTNWQANGLDCSAERHLGLSENFAFAEADEAEIAGMVRAVAGEGAEAAAIVCTNLAGAAIAPALEAELGIPVYDSVAVSLWKAMDLARLETAAITGWGSLFAPH
ncbi:aspartate/glutamate racemase family protein [Methylobacterium sp. J-026]|uniref:maleate cis-trans isomerase family protein n=1 Tax=Methylobacterium sp. J-026 TaxID=2836624 RepID=UPI001FB9C24D|nr:aspartate/glutamate racemase family protein [Methylobacterium sp. J-026]MCJ2137076.1 aspartate/glutamate racemase family protein [Methylobacterium sp. J-026]